MAWAYWLTVNQSTHWIHCIIVNYWFKLPCTAASAQGRPFNDSLHWLHTCIPAGMQLYHISTELRWRRSTS